MKIGIPAETRPGETRVAATPETVKKLVAAKHQVLVQSGAGISSSITDEAYAAAGAQVVDAAAAFGVETVLKVRAPSAEELPLLKSGTVVVGMLNLLMPTILL
ncbi:alanine dehydrogenase/PNT, N-terminal domain protein [Collimonas arenae]|nr:alanine dehydrogenase/PNT, N-terminal domain protein [Collimonas arenae]